MAEPLAVVYRRKVVECIRIKRHCQRTPNASRDSSRVGMASLNQSIFINDAWTLVSLSLHPQHSHLPMGPHRGLSLGVTLSLRRHYCQAATRLFQFLQSGPATIETHHHINILNHFATKLLTPPVHDPPGTIPLNFS